MEKRELKLKNHEIIQIWKALSKLEGTTGGSVHFKFATAVNKNILKPLIAVMEELEKPSARIVEYMQKYHSLLKGYEADGLNNQDAQLRFKDDKPKLDEDYLEDIEERNKQLGEFSKFLEDSQEIELQTITTNDLVDAFKEVDPKLVTAQDFSCLLLLT